MSESSSIPAPFTPLLKDWAAEAAERQEHQAELRHINRDAIFDVLAAAGLTVVIVSFDGYGDSGQIENIEAQGENPKALQTAEVQFATIPWGKSEPDHSPMALENAVEQLAYDFLNELQDGWEDNDGSYGEFTFDVAGRRIILDFNARYIASDNHNYDL